MKGFFAGLGLGIIATAMAAGWLIKKIEDQPVMFPSKSIYDDGDTFHFEGSIYGVGENSPVNNYISTWCYQSTMECKVLTLDEIGGGRPFVGAPFEDTIIVREWNGREIIADSQGLDPRQCNWYELRIDRATKEIAYTRIPNENPDRSVCGEMVPKVYRWRIDNGIAHRQDSDGTMRD